MKSGSSLQSLFMVKCLVDELILDRPITELGLYQRAENILRSVHIDTIRKLTQSSERVFLSYRGAGTTSLKSIKRELNKLGLSLQQET